MHSGQVFILAIVALSMLGGTAKMWFQARHGLPVDAGERTHRNFGMWAPWMSRSAHFYGGDDSGADRKIRLLADDNEKLAGKVSRLEERLAVLERIATDPAERTAREIDALRDR